MPTTALGRQAQITSESYLARRVDQPFGPMARALADALDIDMTTVRQRQGNDRADDLMTRLQALTSKQLSNKWPSMPAADANQDWPAILRILEDLC